jgi:hypothetical protein
MINKVIHDTSSENKVLRIESHIDNMIEVRYFEAKEKSREFINISSYDKSTKEFVEFFISGAALEEFIERTAAICALRFRNKGS